MPTQSRQQNISDLRKNLPTILEQIASSGEPLVVTKRGRPLVKIVPVSASDESDEALPLRGVPLEIGADFDEPLGRGLTGDDR